MTRKSSRRVKSVKKRATHKKSKVRSNKIKRKSLSKKKRKTKSKQNKKNRVMKGGNNFNTYLKFLRDNTKFKENDINLDAIIEFIKEYTRKQIGKTPPTTKTREYQRSYNPATAGIKPYQIKCIDNMYIFLDELQTKHRRVSKELPEDIGSHFGKIKTIYFAFYSRNNRRELEPDEKKTLERFN